MALAQDILRRLGKAIRILQQPGSRSRCGPDGSVTIHFGGDPGSVNHLPITAGWNYVVRMYQPRRQVVGGSWKFPDAQPAQVGRADR
jgi:hypothetical protein